MQIMNHCQEESCSNIGAHSCSSCGKFVCGKHFRNVGDQRNLCKTCFLDYQKKRTMLMSLGVCAGGFIFLFINVACVAPGIILIFIGIGGLIAGYTGHTGPLFRKDY